VKVRKHHVLYVVLTKSHTGEADGDTAAKVVDKAEFR